MKKNDYHPVFRYEDAKDGLSFCTTEGMLYEEAAKRPAEWGHIS